MDDTVHAADFEDDMMNVDENAIDTSADGDDGEGHGEKIHPADEEDESGAEDGDDKLKDEDEQMDQDDENNVEEGSSTGEADETPEEFASSIDQGLDSTLNAEEGSRSNDQTHVSGVDKKDASKSKRLAAYSRFLKEWLKHLTDANTGSEHTDDWDQGLLDDMPDFLARTSDERSQSSLLGENDNDLFAFMSARLAAMELLSAKDDVKLSSMRYRDLRSIGGCQMACRKHFSSSTKTYLSPFISVHGCYLGNKNSLTPFAFIDRALSWGRRWGHHTITFISTAKLVDFGFIVVRAKHLMLALGIKSNKYEHFDSEWLVLGAVPRATVVAEFGLGDIATRRNMKLRKVDCENIGKQVREFNTKNVPPEAQVASKRVKVYERIEEALVFRHRVNVKRLRNNDECKEDALKHGEDRTALEAEHKTSRLTCIFHFPKLCQKEIDTRDIPLVKVWRKAHPEKVRTKRRVKQVEDGTESSETDIEDHDESRPSKRQKRRITPSRENQSEAEDIGDAATSDADDTEDTGDLNDLAEMLGSLKINGDNLVNIVESHPGAREVLDLLAGFSTLADSAFRRRATEP